MSKFVVYFGLFCAVSLVSINSLPVQNESEEIDENLESVEVVAIENEAEVDELTRVQREADPDYRSHHHKHHRRPYPRDEGCWNCGGGGGGGGFSGASSQSFAGNSGGYGGGFGGRPFGGGGGGSSANSQSASFSVNSPLGSFSAAQSSSGANSFGRF